ncbi:uncharacterized protein LOC131165337 isoform X1 [Malania oleifera]|uniref:uncharacterized protein LOC131165337 isoform X1 n=1 Tax=Malania oleifera TaxID=397392 RepID=UPI0025ADB88D|nr:uncharacterized protein LOC131165337 isoform X1 [Malania oleifera]
MLPDEARSRKRPTDLFRFVRMEDRKRALVSRLLQYSLVHEVLGIPSDEISINRTAEGKPYVECDQMNLEFPNFNFNTSHHGDYVAIASEPICLVGVDIVSRTIPKNEAVPEFILNFSSYFSTWEWSKIIYSNSCDEMLNEFYRYWCLKEAFVKAIGTGMWYRLDKIEFHHNRWSDIFVKIDGRELEDWKFWLSELGKGHWVCLNFFPILVCPFNLWFFKVLRCVSSVSQGILNVARVCCRLAAAAYTTWDEGENVHIALSANFSRKLLTRIAIFLHFWSSLDWCHSKQSFILLLFLRPFES